MWADESRFTLLQSGRGVRVTREKGCTHRACSKTDLNPVEDLWDVLEKLSAVIQVPRHRHKIQSV